MFIHHNLCMKCKFYLMRDKIYLFNDQVVVKLPNEEFSFEPHRDNQFKPFQIDGI